VRRPGVGGPPFGGASIPVPVVLATLSGVLPVGLMDPVNRITVPPTDGNLVIG
jgi:hypothetical protein